MVLTIFNVILGELVPKSLALQFPTQIARVHRAAHAVVAVDLRQLHPLS